MRLHCPVAGAMLHRQSARTCCALRAPTSVRVPYSAARPVQRCAPARAARLLPAGWLRMPRAAPTPLPVRTPPAERAPLSAPAGCCARAASTPSSTAWPPTTCSSTWCTARSRGASWAGGARQDRKERMLGTRSSQLPGGSVPLPASVARGACCAAAKAAAASPPVQAGAGDLV